MGLKIGRQYAPGHQVEQLQLDKVGQLLRKSPGLVLLPVKPRFRRPMHLRGCAKHG